MPARQTVGPRSVSLLRDECFPDLILWAAIQSCKEIVSAGFRYLTPFISLSESISLSRSSNWVKTSRSHRFHRRGRRKSYAAKGRTNVCDFVIRAELVHWPA